MSSADAILSECSLKLNQVRQIVDVQVKYLDLTKQGHPTDLILRELALYEFQVNDKKNYFNEIPNSEFIRFIKMDNTQKSLLKKVRYYSPY